MKVILFDYDGTLNNSLEANFHAFQGVAKEFGLPTITLQQFLDWYNPNWYPVYQKMGVPIDSWKKADETWLRHYYQRRSRLFPDSVRTLNALKLIGCKVGLVTGGTRDRVEKELKMRRIHDLFDTIIYGSDVMIEELKPSPMQIRMALKQLREEAREAVYVGDTPIDVLAGRKAGVTTVATTRGFSSAERLRRAKPDFIIHNLRELLEIIKENRAR